jgi:hypothetical protein
VSKWSRGLLMRNSTMLAEKRCPSCLLPAGIIRCIAVEKMLEFVQESADQLFDGAR